MRDKFKKQGKKMIDLNTTSGKHFRCTCGWARHSLYISTDNEDPFRAVGFQVINAACDLSLLARLRMVWSILRADEHVLSEVYVHQDDIPEMVEWLLAS